MATLNFLLEIDNSNGQTVFFKDTSLDEIFTDTVQVRILCGNYPNQLNPTQLVPGDSLLRYHQYQLTSATTVTYDGVILTIGSYFIPQIDGLTVQAGDSFAFEGFVAKYIAPATYLPDNTQNVFNLTEDYWGLSTLDSIFPSLVYTLQYEIYGDTTPNPLTNVTTDKQYFVTGTGSATAHYNGSVYRVGSVFIAIDNGAVTFTGDGNLTILIASKNRYQVLFFPLQYRYLQLYLKLQCCTSKPNLIMTQILIEFYGSTWASFTQWVSASKSTDTLAWIDQQLSILEFQNP